MGTFGRVLTLQLKNISPKIDSCTGLILQKANGAYQRISPDHQRWIDPEDLIQEGLVAALAAQKTHRDTGRAKYSTYLYNGLMFHFDRYYTTPLSQQKRAKASLVELDAPRFPGADQDEVKLDLPDQSFTSNQTSNAVKSFMELVRRLSAKAVGVLATSLLCGKWVDQAVLSDEKIMGEISTRAKILGIGFDDLQVVAKDENSRKKALTMLGNSDIMELGIEADVRVLECVECRGQFTLSAIRDGRYYVDTTTCRTCYLKMQRASSELSCFGKPKRLKQEGYSDKDVECRIHCRDRKECRQFIEKRSKIMADEDVATANEEVKEVEDAVKNVKGKAKAKKKAVKKAPKAVAKKAKKDLGPPPPKDVGPYWPHKRGSTMQEVFKAAYHGVKIEDLKKELLKTGHESTLPIFLQVLRRGYTGENRKTHTWKLNEEGGRFKIFDVKFVGDQNPKKVKAVAKSGKKAKAAAK